MSGDTPKPPVWQPSQTQKAKAGVRQTRQSNERQDQEKTVEVETTDSPLWAGEAVRPTHSRYWVSIARQTQAR